MNIFKNGTSNANTTYNEINITDVQSLIQSYSDSMTNQSDTSEIKSHKGQIFSAGRILQTNSSANVDNCERICNEMDTCTGGNFIATSNGGGNCTFYGGKGNLSEASDNSTTAFVKTTTETSRPDAVVKKEQRDNKALRDGETDLMNNPQLNDQLQKSMAEQNQSTHQVDIMQQVGNEPRKTMIFLPCKLSVRIRNISFG